jgi:hypothetical protein
MTITNLYSRCCYYGDGWNQPSNLPIVITVHGWDGQIDGFSFTDRIAKSYPVFMVAVGMRGRSNAGGTRDASGREIHDIYDVIAPIRARFPTIVSSDKVALIGSSGGGGNGLAAACKFPDSFTVISDAFGMSDYGKNNPDGWYYNAPGGYPDAVATAVGGTPEEVPNNYYARDAVAAITNFSGGKLFIFHDQEDSIVPVVHSNRIISAYTEADAYISKVGDPIRYEHTMSETGTAQLDIESKIIPEILSRAAWTIPASGTVTVIGYIVTKRFTIWLNSGLDAVATVVYNTAIDTYTVTPLTTGDVTVVITQGSKTATATISSETEMVVT